MSLSCQQHNNSQRHQQVMRLQAVTGPASGLQGTRTLVMASCSWKTFQLQLR